MKQLKAIVQLRRKNINDYDGNEIFRRGEALLVDSYDEGLRIKIGDGETKFEDLEFLDDVNHIIIRGYYHEGAFFRDLTYRKRIAPSKIKIYIDNLTNLTYLYDGTGYGIVNNVPLATPEIPGIMKLYASLGNNADGACDQETVTVEIGKKIEVDCSDGVLSFTK